MDAIAPFPPGQRLLDARHFYRNAALLTEAKQRPTPVTLRHLANFGKRLTPEKLIGSANFVRSELPLRLARKIAELQRLPFAVLGNRHLNQVYQSYYHCYAAFRRVDEIKTLEDNENFCRFVFNMLNDHLVVLPHLMMGALEVSALGAMPQHELDLFMSSMLRSRISRRVIMDQHYSMSQSYNKSVAEGLEQGDKPPDFVGDAFQYISTHDQLHKCYASISRFLESQDADVQIPELIIEGDQDVRFQFMTNHLNYIMTEVMRNGLKSTIEQTKLINKRSSVPRKTPPFKVTISNFKDNIFIKFSDQGGGVSLSKLPKVWSFGKTPELARYYLQNFHNIPGLKLPQRLPIVDHAYLNNEKITNVPPLQGVLSDLGNLEVNGQGSMLKTLSQRPFQNTLGISLPMCKVYADYWNGELSMDSVEGYGTDVIWRISKLGSAQGEVARVDRA